MARRASHWLKLSGVCLTGAIAFSQASAEEPLQLQATPPVASDVSAEADKPAPQAADPAPQVGDAVDLSQPAAKATDKDAKPAAEDATTATDKKTAAAPEVEVIRERFPNGKVRIEREVVRDKDDNYVNNGSWKMWDEQGNVVAEGKYAFGQRNGKWTGWFMPKEVQLLTEMPYSEYTGPFISEAEFDNGKLNGEWVITDSKHRKVNQWGYLEGHRHGTWTTWYANGRKMREVHYVNGDLDGEVCEWTPDGKQTNKDTYQQGRKLARKVEYHSDHQKKTDGMFLFAKQELQADDDWWNAKLAKFVTVGKDERHGEWTAWHPNGQMQMQGTYEHDAPVGAFNWWYSSGQKSVVGGYVNGQRNGEWTWYHPNGQKATHGEFVMGGPNNRWVWWADSGKVAQRVDYSPGKGELAKAPGDKHHTSSRAKPSDSLTDPSASDLTPPPTGTESEVPESAKANDLKLQR